MGGGVVDMGVPVSGVSGSRVLNEIAVAQRRRARSANKNVTPTKVAGPTAASGYRRSPV